VRFEDGHVRWYTVRGFGRVLVSAQARSAGDPLGAADLSSEERDVVALGCAPLTSLDAARSWRAARRLAAGEALCAQSAQPAPDVARGAAVTLSAARGAIQVSRELVAAHDAWTGERVRLRDPATGDVVKALVTGQAAARSLE
jgi:flagellar basal body P-ring formation protein FlgA